jgi:hypothetical protein
LTAANYGLLIKDIVAELAAIQGPGTAPVWHGRVTHVTEWRETAFIAICSHTDKILSGAQSIIIIRADEIMDYGPKALVAELAAIQGPVTAPICMAWARHACHGMA